jgi:hypothetical protein
LTEEGEAKLLFRGRFDDLIPGRFYPLLPTVFELHEREAGLVFRQRLLKILKVNLDGFAIRIFEFHASIIDPVLPRAKKNIGGENGTRLAAWPPDLPQLPQPRSWHRQLRLLIA